MITGPLKTSRQYGRDGLQIMGCVFAIIAVLGAAYCVLWLVAHAIRAGWGG